MLNILELDLPGQQSLGYPGPQLPLSSVAQLAESQCNFPQTDQFMVKCFAELVNRSFRKVDGLSGDWVVRSLRKGSAIVDEYAL